MKNQLYCEETTSLTQSTAVQALVIHTIQLQHKLHLVGHHPQLEIVLVFLLATLSIIL